MNAISKGERLSCILLGSFYLLALVPGTLLAWIGTVWMGASDRGWQTQVAAGALIVGWVALAVGAVLVFKASRAGAGWRLFCGAASGLIAIVCYLIFFMWGGRMFI